MGLLPDVSEDKLYERNGGTIRVLELELTNDKGFMLTNGDELSVVVIQFAKVKWYMVSNSTRLLWNPEIPEVQDFKNSIACHGIYIHGSLRMIDDLPFSMRDEFLSFFPRKTVEDLQLMEEDENFICLATVDAIVKDGFWWYKLRLKVNDGTEKANFVLFDFDCAYLLDNSCATLVDQLQVKKPSHEYPEELNKLVGNEYLFKVEVNDDMAFRFDDSFKVKKVCQDEEIIREFKDEASIKTPKMEPMVEDLDDGVLGGESENVDKFAGLTELYNDNEFRLTFVGECSNASAYLAPQKRKNQSRATALGLSKKRGIAKTIKIEKD
ncbi:Nucleic acid-binding, OB-fold [Sesbania bispinosa]|nr:Nucleic acid-binding, OB-fold [Sesbania bispinosa]